MAIILEEQTDIRGKGHRLFYRQAAGAVAAADLVGLPANVGDMILNMNPVAGGGLLDRCTAGGSPGTWETVATEMAVSVALTNAQTKATNTAPIVIVPAQGAGTLIEVISLTLENVFLTGAFAAGGALALYYGTNSGGVLGSATVAATFLTSPAANQMIFVAGALASNLASNVLNKDLVLANPTADFTTGAGSLMVKVRFRVHSGLS